MCVALIVESDTDLQTLLALKIRRAGHEPIIAASAAEARDVLGSQTADMVLLARHLPDTDGLELCRALRSNPDTARLPIVIIGSAIDEANLEAAFDAGANDFVNLPTSVGTLIDHWTGGP